jgi:hypothetical protein
MSGDYTGMLRIVECSRKYNGAFPVWMGPTDANNNRTSIKVATLIFGYEICN